MSSEKPPRSSEREQRREGGGHASEDHNAQHGIASAVSEAHVDAVSTALVKKIVLSRVVELQAWEKKLECDRERFMLLWRAYHDDMGKLQDALNDAYATASMISADATCVSCTQDFNSYAEMLYNRLHGDESELLTRWQGSERI
ncbi:hypothetical protein PRIC2_013824 [Phytophthora ramorum]